MALFNTPKEFVENFLGANFHLDIEDYKSALQEYLNDEHPDCIKEDAEAIEHFLSSNISKKAKEKFIKEHAHGIGFDYLKIDPVKWLRDEVLPKMKQAVKNNTRCCD
ncbi:hypothetical protein LSG31_00460 [Fodinisporobacter ferrooxydans]|uniref:CdiI immunity protein domain-containing protein n=1 Tax=Fodinisporobacter ferrooxydans TaxID=2901836 RepID=A0ABY4CJU8_9BACL|nr:hypothetical protein LSG31_00460 [Alicyclobacillaceae bacterium MYW30-H2]